MLQKNKNNLFTTQRKEFQTILNNGTVFNESKTTSGTIDGIQAFYTNAITIIPGTFKLLTVSYYDNYDFPNPPVIPDSVAGAPSVYYNNSSRKPKGLPTASWVRVLQNQTDINGEISYTLYDNKSRPVKSKTTNYLGGFTDVESLIDFSGKTLLTVTRHKRNPNRDEIRIDEAFTYSPEDRLLTHTHQINGGAIELLAANTYTEMGQLQTKKVGTATDGTSGLQKVDYSYNIRGWLTGINDTQNLEDNDAAHPDLFAFKINYNTLDNNQQDVKKLYNGNIAETRWRTDFDNLTRSYGYTYDALNRLTNAQYVRPSNPANPNSADIIDTFNETLSYDKNGNIQKLVRNGGLESQTTVPVMDNLKYKYDTNDKNRLIKVTDNTANSDGFNDGANTQEEYGYDLNGNMIRDDNKNIRSIVYNHLNLPTRIVIQNGGDFPSISYLYTATGKKVAKTVNNASRNRIVYTVDYLDGFQYESEKLLFFPTAEGYVKYTENATNPFDYVFNYTDHLGNIRLSYGINPETRLLKKMEENNYYPFGLKHTTYNTENIIIVPKLDPEPVEEELSGKYMKLKEEYDLLKNFPLVNGPPQEDTPVTLYSGYNYKYNGKEYQDELGLNMYDYGARNYDPALGRWMNMDPLAETSRRFSPYTYALNNPVFFIDPDGMEARGADGFTNDEWLSNNRRNIDRQMGGNGIDIASMTYNTDEERAQNEKEKGKSTVSVGDAEIVDSGGNSDADQQIDPKKGEKLTPEQENEKQRKYNEEKLIPLAENIIAFAVVADAVRGVSGLLTLKWSSVTSLFGSSGLKLGSTISKVMGKSYESISSVSVPIKNAELLSSLNATSKGTWVKIYEAGIQNGTKIETHYFKNINTRQVFDVKIKYNYWHQKAFKNLR